MIDPWESIHTLVLPMKTSGSKKCVTSLHSQVTWWKKRGLPSFHTRSPLFTSCVPMALKSRLETQQHNKFQKILGRHLIHCQFSKEVVWCPLVHRQHISQIKPKPKFFFTKPQVSDFYLFVWMVGGLAGLLVCRTK